MDDNDKQAARKSRDISTQLEEENLWDLEDDWENGDEEAPAEQPSPEASDEKEDEPSNDDDIAPEEEDHPSDDDEEEEQEEFELPLEDEEEEPLPALDNEPESESTDAIEEEQELEIDEDELPSPQDQAPISLEESYEEIEDTNPAEEPSPATTEDSPDNETPSDPEAPATAALKKLSLSSAEKITLGSLAVILIGLAIWGCIWLRGKNKIANTRETVELPVEGKHATITELTTFWISPEKGPGVNLNAIVVPAVTITLDEETSRSGALRLFFRNADKISIGDPITLPFQNGQFSNGSNTIEVSASDGFHQEGQFHAYQVDGGVPWRVHILESSSVTARGSEFKELLDAPVDAKRR